MTCANARVPQLHKKTESNNTHKKESQHEDKHRSCGQEHDLHQNMKFFSATTARSAWTKSSFDMSCGVFCRRPGMERVVSRYCLPNSSNAHFGLFTTCGHIQGVGFPTSSRIQLLLRPDSRTWWWEWSCPRGCMCWYPFLFQQKKAAQHNSRWSLRTMNGSLRSCVALGPGSHMDADIDVEV